MSYNDFIAYIGKISGEEKTYADLENIIQHGISWCEDGRDENGEQTTLCAHCVHYRDCEVIQQEFETA